MGHLDYGILEELRRIAKALENIHDDLRPADELVETKEATQ